MIDNALLLLHLNLHKIIFLLVFLLKIGKSITSGQAHEVFKGKII